jgi:predicted metalloprotease with PDZ domain
MQVDTEPSTDENGQPVPDLRLRVDFAADTSRRPQLAVTNPTTVWAKAGLQTGDELIAFNGTQIRAFADLQRVLRGLHVGDHAIVEIRRNGQPRTIDVIVSGFNRPRVHFSDAPNITTEQRAHRRAWLFGGLAQS